jgi:hypothetical protein
VRDDRVSLCQYSRSQNGSPPEKSACQKEMGFSRSQTVPEVDREEGQHTIAWESAQVEPCTGYVGHVGVASRSMAAQMVVFCRCGWASFEVTVSEPNLSRSTSEVLSQRKASKGWVDGMPQGKVMMKMEEEIPSNCAT